MMLQQTDVRRSFLKPPASFAEDAPSPGDADSSLDEAVRAEREYVRKRLREELKREPTDEELNDWLRQHTEGY